MRESGWVHIKYIDYYEQLISCTWLPYHRQECLSLPISELSGRSDRRMFMKLRGEASGGENRYILRNEANKPFRINKSSSEEVQKATN